MAHNPELWATDAAGELSAVFGTYRVTVKPLPTTGARFIVWSLDNQHALTSGTFESTSEAILRAEAAALRIVMAHHGQPGYEGGNTTGELTSHRRAARRMTDSESEAVARHLEQAGFSLMKLLGRMN